MKNFLLLLSIIQILFVIQGWAQSGDKKYDRIFITDDNILIGTIINENNETINFLNIEDNKKITLYKSNLKKIIRKDGSIYTSILSSNMVDNTKIDNNYYWDNGDIFTYISLGFSSPEIFPFRSQSQSLTYSKASKMMVIYKKTGDLKINTYINFVISFNIDVHSGGLLFGTPYVEITEAKMKVSILRESKTVYQETINMPDDKFDYAEKHTYSPWLRPLSFEDLSLNPIFIFTYEFEGSTYSDQMGIVDARLNIEKK